MDGYEGQSISLPLLPQSFTCNNNHKYISITFSRVENGETMTKCHRLVLYYMITRPSLCYTYRNKQ